MAIGNSVWWRGRRSRAMTRNALEINKNRRVGTLRFSLWKPSPFGLWFLSLESWRLDGVLLKAVTSWCQNCPAERQGRIIFYNEVHSRILLGFGRWRIFGALGGSQCVPSHSEVVFEIAGNRRSRKRPQSDLGHNGSPQSPKSPGGNFGRWRTPKC